MLQADRGFDDRAGPAAMSRSLLGRELRRLRQSRSLRLEDVAGHLGIAAATVSRIETGEAPAKASYLTVMLALYGVDDAGQRKELEDLAVDGWRKSWWADCHKLLPAGAGRYLDLETAASHLWSFSAQAIPGLLQTGRYAAALCQVNRPGLTADEIHALTQLQAQRQATILSGGGRCLDMVMDESVLYRSVGSAAVMTGQARHLLEIASHPSLTLHVVELSTIRRVLSPSVTILRLARPAGYDIGCHPDRNGQITFTTGTARLRALHDTFTALRDSARPLTDTRAFATMTRTAQTRKKP